MVRDKVVPLVAPLPRVTGSLSAVFTVTVALRGLGEVPLIAYHCSVMLKVALETSP